MVKGVVFKLRDLGIEGLKKLKAQSSKLKAES